MICCDERKSLPNSSHGTPPVPDGLAHNTIFRVPPALGAWVVGVVVVEVDALVVVEAGVEVEVKVEVAFVVVVELVSVLPQPSINEVTVISAIKRINNLFIFISLPYYLYFVHACYMYKVA
jgi:hypothetical protein